MLNAKALSCCSDERAFVFLNKLSTLLSEFIPESEINEFRVLLRSFKRTFKNYD